MKTVIGFLIVLLAIAYASLSCANSYTWTGNGGDQNWSNALNWSPNGVPGASDTTLVPTSAVVRASGATTSALSNSGTLIFKGSGGLSLEGLINNFSLIQSDTASGINNLAVPLGQAATLVGGGQVVLNGYSSYINYGSSGTLTNQDNLIHGWGTIYGNLVNSGSVEADSKSHTLFLYGTLANNGFYEAVGGGTLTISNASVSNTGGTILASGTSSLVQLSGGTISGGTLHTTNGGLVQSQSGALIANVTNAGTLSYLDQTYLQGQISNLGLIQSGMGLLNWPSRAGLSYQLAVGNGQTATLTGGGQVLLSSTGSRITGTLANQDNLIHGWGTINSTLVNSGTVAADSSYGVLYIEGALRNDGLYAAQNGGTLNIESSVVNNGTVLSSGSYSVVQLSSGTISGGTLDTNNGGLIQSSGVSLVNSVNAGTLAIQAQGGSLTNVTNGGTLNYFGTVYLQGQFNNLALIQGSTASWSILTVSSGQAVTLTGSGQISLNGSAINGSTSSGTLTNQDNLIHGWGTIYDPVVNYGTVAADTSGRQLSIDGVHVQTNNGTWMAQNGGILSLSGSVTNQGSCVAQNGGVIQVNASVANAGGTFTASGSNSWIELGSTAPQRFSTISGGTLSTSSGGVVLAASGSMANLTNSGTLVFSNPGLSIQGQINNFGLIQSNSGYLSIYQGYLWAPRGQTATLSGGGQVLLNNPSSCLNCNQSSSCGTLTNQNNLIHGWGSINGSAALGISSYGVFINNGTVAADSNGNTLNILGNESNTGIYEAQNGGTLAIDTSVANAGGTIMASGSNSTVRISGTITGGTISSTNGGLVQAYTSTFATLTNAGTLTFGGGSSSSEGLCLLGQINNTGFIQSDMRDASSGAGLSVPVGQSATLVGGGQVLLAHDRSFINYPNPGSTSGTLTNQDNLIHGCGEICGNLINCGTVAADVNGHSLSVGLYFGGVRNYGLCEAINGGTLTLGAANDGGTILASGSNSVVQLWDSWIDGGTLSTTNGGVMVAFGNNFLQDRVNNVGLIQSIQSGGMNLEVYPGLTATLAGGGQILLSGTASSINRPSLNPTSTGTLINQDNLIHGCGTIGGNFVNNAGTVAADSSGNTLWISGPVTNNSAFQAANGGTLNIGAPVAGTGSIIANAGVVVQNADVTQSLVDASLGTYQLQSGKLTVPCFLGVLNQTGGTFTTGLAAAVGCVSGDYLQSSGALLMKLGGTQAGQSDGLTIGGNATLNGTLAFQVLGGYGPGPYDAFPIIHLVGTRSGSFGLTEGQVVNVGAYPFHVTFLAGNGTDVALYNGVNPNDVPIDTAAPSQPASISTSYTSPNNGATLAFASLDVLPGGTGTLGASDTLQLSNGPLYVAPGGVFTAAGSVMGNIANTGLLHLPLRRLNEVSNIQGNGYTQVSLPPPGPSPATPLLPPLSVNTGAAIELLGASNGSGSPNPLVIDTPQLTNSGVVIPARPGVPGSDALMDLTGSYQQQTDGKLRLFISGSNQGVNYSHLIVNGPVSLSGEMQIVLEPDLSGFVPTVGETFDLLDSPAGITIPDGLVVNDFVTAAGGSYLSGVSLSGYNSGIVDDPDQMMLINGSVLSYQIVHSTAGDTLRATYLGVVPEPGTLALLSIGAISFAVWRRKKVVRSSLARQA